MARFKEPRADANKPRRTLSQIIAQYDVDANTAKIMASVEQPVPSKLEQRIAAKSVVNDVQTPGRLTQRIQQYNIERIAPITDLRSAGSGRLAQRLFDYERASNNPKTAGNAPRTRLDMGDSNLARRVRNYRSTTATPSANNSFNALSRFLSSFGDRLRSLFGASRNTLASPDPMVAVTMKDKALEALTASTQQAMRTAFDKYSQGRIDRKQFAQEMEMQIRRQALGAAIIGVEGTGNLTANVIEATRGTVAQQLAYLDGFIRDIEGRPTTNRDRARAMQYGNAAFSIAQTAMRQFDLDDAKNSNHELEEKRILGAADEHCDDCKELALGDWEPFGTYPVPGTGTICGSNCRCELVRRYKDDSTPNPTNENSEGQL